MENKKKAYFAMSMATVLIMVISALSDELSAILGYLTGKYYISIENVIVSILSSFKISVPMAKVFAKELLSSGIHLHIISLIVIVVTMVIPALIFSKAVHLTFDETFPVGGKKIKGLFTFFCTTQLITYFISEFSGGLYDFIVPPVPDIYTGNFEAISPSVFSLIMSVLCTCILVPVCEEYIFRGVLFSYLSRYGLSFGIIASAVLFGVAHSAPTQSVFAFTFGIISAFAVAITGNIKTSVILHAMNNTISVIFGYLPIYLTESMTGIIFCIFSCVTTFVGIIGIYRFCKDKGLMDEFCEKCKVCDPKEPHGLKQLLVFPLVIYVIIYAYNFCTQVM